MNAPAPALSAVPGSLVIQPQFLFFVVVGVAWLFKAIGKAKAAFLSQERGAQEAGRPSPAEEPGPVETGLSEEERTLLVRRDILEKRARRQAEAAALARMPAGRQAPAPPPLARRAAAAVAAPARAALAPLAPSAAAQAGPLAGDSPAAPAGAPWLEELRNRDSVRRAVLLREILGQPVALR